MFVRLHDGLVAVLILLVVVTPHGNEAFSTQRPASSGLTRTPPTTAAVSLARILEKNQPGSLSIRHSPPRIKRRLRQQSYLSARRTTSASVDDDDSSSTSASSLSSWTQWITGVANPQRPAWARDWMPTELVRLRPALQLVVVLLCYIFHMTVLAQHSVPFPVQLIPNERGQFQSIGWDS